MMTVPWLTRSKADIAGIYRRFVELIASVCPESICRQLGPMLADAFICSAGAARSNASSRMNWRQLEKSEMPKVGTRDFSAASGRHRDLKSCGPCVVIVFRG